MARPRAGCWLSQVKSGESWFRKSTPEGLVFRPKGKHVKYWLGHSLPVAVVLVDVQGEGRPLATRDKRHGDLDGEGMEDDHPDY